MPRTSTSQTFVKQKSGFTIVELLIVIIVIGILAALVLVAYSNVTDQAKIAAVKNDLEQIVKQLNTYKEQTGGGTTYPADASGLTYSSGTTIQYTVNNTGNPATYCVSGVNGSATYFVTNTANAPATGNCTPYGAGTVAWWKLNGNGADSSGSGNSASVSGPVQIAGQNGLNPGAYNFSGGSNISTPTNNLPAGSSARTVTAWVNALANPSSGWSMVYNYGATSYGASSQSALSINTSGRVSFNSNSNDFVSSLVLPLNSWHFVAYSINGTAVTVWMDTQTQSGTLSGAISTGTGNSYIGLWSPGSNVWNGGIDDLRVYSRALSNSEVQAIYSAGAQ